jgi:two-component system sensor histidine kinase KdpD
VVREGGAKSAALRFCAAASNPIPLQYSCVHKSSRILNYVMATAATAAAVLLLLAFQPHANLATVALSLLLIVTMCAIRWGSGPGFLAALCAGLCLNYFFIPPLRTWNIAHPQDWIAFLVFIATALLVGQLSSRAQSQAIEAEQRRSEIEDLYDQLKRAFEEASEAESLRRSEKLKTALLDSVTHDLRTPLTSIKASVTTLLGTGDQQSLVLQPDARRELLDVINEETDRLNRFVEEMMQMAKVEAGVLPLDCAPVSAQEIIQAALDRAEPLLSRHRVEIAVPPGLPPLLVDASSIAGVIFELLQNASKYAPAGSSIDIAARRSDGEMVDITVADEGPGVPHGLRTRVFEKFFRVTAMGDGRGFGLGLTIARGIVEAHGGRIWIEEGPNKRGSAVSFTVPCQSGARSDAGELSAHTRSR